MDQQRKKKYLEELKYQLVNEALVSRETHDKQLREFHDLDPVLPAPISLDESLRDLSRQKGEAFAKIKKFSNIRADIAQEFISSLTDQEIIIFNRVSTGFRKEVELFDNIDLHLLQELFQRFLRKHSELSLDHIVESHASDMNIDQSMDEEPPTNHGDASMPRRASRKRGQMNHMFDDMFTDESIKRPRQSAEDLPSTPPRRRVQKRGQPDSTYERTFGEEIPSRRHRADDQSFSTDRRSSVRGQKRGQPDHDFEHVFRPEREVRTRMEEKRGQKRIHRPMAEENLPRKKRVETGEGLERSNKFKTYVDFGKHILHLGDLQGGGVLNIKHKSGPSVEYLPKRSVSSPLKSVILDAVSKGEVDPRKAHALDEGDKKYLSHVLHKCNIDSPLTYKADKTDWERFQVLQGELGAGNDNVELVMELKGLIMRLQRKGEIKKKDALKALAEIDGIH